MNKRCAFTIVAKNYIGLAQVLEKSIQIVDSDIDFFIFVADEFCDLTNKTMLSGNILIAKDVLGLDIRQWTDMTYKYDLTEFCTAIKPSCFKYLLNKANYKQILYFDPDICVFSSLQFIYSLFDKHSILLTPQTVGIHQNYDGELPEWNLFANGIFNLGFCGIKQSEAASKMLDWWEERLKDKCFMDRVYVYFTDQKWMDLLPSFFDNDTLHISHNLGMNLAPWNYFEREIIKKGDIFYVRYRKNEGQRNLDKLIFFHAAGYSYVDFQNGIIKRKRINSLKSYSDIEPLLAKYKDLIIANKEIFNKYIKLPYSYNYYDNGILIDKFHRRLYHGLFENHSYISSPFSTINGSFYSALINRRMIHPNQNIDQFNKENIPNINQRKKYIRLFFKILYRLIGYKRYVLFVRSLLYYSRMEEHIFLINKQIITFYDKNSPD